MDNIQSHIHWPETATAATILSVGSVMNLTQYQGPDVSSGDYALTGAFPDEDWSQAVKLATYRTSPTASSAELPVLNEHAPDSSLPSPAVSFSTILITKIVYTHSQKSLDSARLILSMNSFVDFLVSYSTTSQANNCRNHTDKD
jgi:hypothetical protein